MTAWTEQEKADIRAFMGFPSLFHQQEPRLENAINSVQSVADGGALVSTATQDRMRAALVRLNAIDASITCLYDRLLVTEVGEEQVKLNASRAIFVLEGQGRRWITQLAIPLGTQPFRDYYSPLPLNSDAFSPFPTDLG